MALVPLAEALARMLDGVAAVEPRRVQLRAAEGMILAEPLQAPRSVPPATIALRDGWAARADALVGASSYSPAFLDERPVFVRAGDTLPPGADCVLPPDVVADTAGAVEITDCVAPGEGVRRAGEDAAAGAVLREAGEALRATDIAAGAAAGLTLCMVRQPRVRVLSVDVKPGEVSDFLQRFVVLAGAQVVHQAVHERTRANALLANPPADLLLLAGDAALAREILQTNGTLVADGLALRPGNTAVCGRIGHAPAILIPPRLEAALALALLLGRPCLDRLAGAALRRPGRRAPLTRKISSQLGMTELVLLCSTPEGLEPMTIGDLSLKAMARADTWIAVPPESEGFPAGEVVEAFLL